MIETSSPVEVHLSLDKEHGLCESAETHWAIYLIHLIQSGLRPALYTAYLESGSSISMLKKGELNQGSDFTFGAESYIVASSDDPSLQNLILVEETTNVLVAREQIELSEALSINGFFDNTPSRWKTLIQNYCAQRGIKPSELDLSQLISQALK